MSTSKLCACQFPKGDNRKFMFSVHFLNDFVNQGWYLSASIGLLSGCTVVKSPPLKLLPLAFIPKMFSKLGVSSDPYSLSLISEKLDRVPSSFGSAFFNFR